MFIKSYLHSNRNLGITNLSNPMDLVIIAANIVHNKEPCSCTLWLLIATRYLCFELAGIIQIFNVIDETNLYDLVYAK